MVAPDPRPLLIGLFHAAVAAADPGHRLADHLPDPPPGRTVVVGAGKASAAMAAALERAWPGVELAGAVAVPDGTTAACDRIELVGAGHPIPDVRSVDAARRMRTLVTGLDGSDLVIALFSGGGSALAAEPADGLGLADKQAVTRGLLASGATIREINAVRQRLSAIKGGRLALAAAPAPVHTLLVSDVPGDDPALVASGPTIAAPFAPDEATGVVERYGIALTPTARALVDHNPPPAAAELGERCRHAIVCSPMQSLEAAARHARERGYEPLILGDGLEGEARHMGTMHAGIGAAIRRWHRPLAPPAVVLSGGEATVTLSSDAGRGGRNTELALALALALDGIPGIHALAADTDGIDGTGDHAGAVVAPDTPARARRAGIDPQAVLASHDSARLFDALGDLVVTGSTGTNVNDFRAIVID